jgi:hypothetical protein
LHIGKIGKGEADGLVSFSKLHKRTKWLVSENYSKFRVSAVVRLLQAGVSESQIHRRLVRAYGQKVFRRQEVSVWCKRFEDDRMAVDDCPEKHRGGQKTLYTDEICVIVDGEKWDDTKVKVCETAFQEKRRSIVHLRCKETLL